MMKINLFFFGKKNEMTGLEHELARRIGFRAKIEILSLPQAGLKDEAKTKEKEGQLFLNKISDQDYIIAFDQEGIPQNSKEFSHWLKQTFLNHNTITFVIGGAYGLSEEVLSRADARLSVGPMTWTRNLFRHMALEQLYRALEIDGGGNFHK